MATKKITIEVEVPEGVSIGERELEAMQTAAKRTLIYLLLEKAQKREPTEEELQELVKEAKRNIYKRIMEEGD